MKATSTREAWSLANEIFPSDYMKSETKSANAGYDIYESTLEGCNAWISDLGNRLEVNLDNGKSINIWLEEEKPTESKKKPVQTETAITLEAVITERRLDETLTTSKETRLTLSHETTLKDIAQFERTARIIIKKARSASNHGHTIYISLSRALYRFTDWNDLTQISYQQWNAFTEDVSKDGVHLNPSKKYNDDPTRDMWLTGVSGELLDEMTI